MSSENSKYQELEDEDLVMEEQQEEDEDEDEERYDSKGKTVFPEDFVRSGSSSSGHLISPQFSRNHSDYTRFDLTAANSPIHDWSEAMDEKGESIALMMHLEKSIVHQKFFSNFDDDFDQDDLA